MAACAARHDGGQPRCGVCAGAPKVRTEPAFGKTSLPPHRDGDTARNNRAPSTGPSQPRSHASTTPLLSCPFHPGRAGRIGRGAAGALAGRGDRVRLAALAAARRRARRRLHAHDHHDLDGLALAVPGGGGSPCRAVLPAGAAAPAALAGGDRPAGGPGGRRPSRPGDRCPGRHGGCSIVCGGRPGGVEDRSAEGTENKPARAGPRAPAGLQPASRPHAARSPTRSPPADRHDCRRDQERRPRQRPCACGGVFHPIKSRQSRSSTASAMRPIWGHQT